MWDGLGRCHCVGVLSFVFMRDTTSWARLANRGNMEALSAIRYGRSAVRCDAMHIGFVHDLIRMLQA